jgi:ABC-2 type transport system permease protein
MLTLPLTIARTTFIESVRQPITFILFGIGLVAIILSTAGTGFAMGYTESSELSGDDKLLFDFGLATVFALSVLLAAFIATATMSREIENKTVLTVVSKPVPRAAVVIGKWIGVTAALLISSTTLLLMLLLALRHGVLSNASDDLDGPVWLFGGLAVIGAILLGGWGSFFYGWSFPQVVTLSLLPFTAIAYVMVLLLSKEWQWQNPIFDLKVQVVVAGLILLLAMPVLTSIAVAASCRLGQVMTIVVCFGMFIFGMLSASFIGRYAFEADAVAQVFRATPERERFREMKNPGDLYFVEVKGGFTIRPKVGDPFYFAASPNGADRPVEHFAPFTGDMGRAQTPGTPPALVITAIEDRKLTVQTVGDRPLQLSRTPREGDWIFLEAPKVHFAALAMWGMVPNLQFFWVLDAVQQNVPVPFSHIGLVGLYSLFQVAAYLSIAVMLFQRRDVG